jgi:prepilin signal peptidase PulO-like enzyme (type II secretory pathway)
LLFLMFAASLIDFDEKIIPDTITVPGTLIGLVLAAAWPWSLWPNVVQQGGGLALDFLKLTSPHPWPPQLAGFPQPWPLLAGLGCWWLWCAAIAPRTWYARHGRLRALRLCWAHLIHRRATYGILLMGLLGSGVIAIVWAEGGASWAGLLSVLVGMAASGGLIWAVRIIGAAVLHREAMGLGDVTLMAMIGAFLGWQACLMVFFLAPLAGAVLGLLQWIVLRDDEITYGPFLCSATLIVLVFWDALWSWAEHIFWLGWLLPLIVVFCLAMMAPLLIIVKFFREVLTGGR